MMPGVIHCEAQHTLITDGGKPVQTGKEMSEFGGFLLQSALSASGSQSTTTSIFHMRRSQCAGTAGVCVIAGYCVCMYVCVGGVLFMGKLHSSVIWLIYGPQLPHLTVRIEADENHRISHSN